MSVVSQSSTDASPPVSPSTEKKASRWARIKTKTQDLQATLDMANLTNDLSERGIDFQKLKAQFPEPDHGILINGDSEPHKKTLRRRKTVQFTEETAPEGLRKFTSASLKEKYKRRDTW